MTNHLEFTKKLNYVYKNLVKVSTTLSSNLFFKCLLTNSILIKYHIFKCAYHFKNAAYLINLWVNKKI